MGYIVTTSFYEGNTLHLQGAAFEHQDEDYVQKCLDDGNITDENDEAASAKSTEAQKLAAIDAEEAARHEALQSQSVSTVVDQPQSSQLNPPQAQVGSQLTPEQVAQGFQNAGVQTSSNVPQQ